MNKRLTVNRLALGNLKARKKQYAIMIIGIILAMIFSSSVILFSFSAMETSKENNKRKYGLQSGIVISQIPTDKDYEKAIADGYLTDYSYIHNIGFAYPDVNQEYLGSPVAWLEDKAWDMYYLEILEGAYPTAENEIAVESTQLNYLGYKDAKIGDTIKLKLEVQNSNGKVVDKEYKLVGIINDRRTNVGENYYDSDGFSRDTVIPGIYVAQNTAVEVGGKEDKIAIYTSDYSKEYQVPGESESTNRFSAPYVYLEQLTKGNGEIRSMGYATFVDNNPSLNALFDGGTYVSIIIIALVFASCIAIINAFNSNLKERKKQIGLFRAVGTTRRQIINIFGREAFIISLIATPVSVAISYLIVKVILNIFSENAIMSKSLWALLVSAVVNVIVVMLASLVPLFIASRITPMQAIRNINVARKVKSKKIKSKKQFNAPSHIASRNTKFYKGSTIAVSVMLIATISFSCLAFSFVSYSMNNLYSYHYDYSFYFPCYDDNEIKNGLTEIDKQAIESLPYVEKVYGEKSIGCEIECDELDNFARIIDSNRYENNESHDYRCAKDADELREWMLENPDDSYYEEKNALKIDKEMYPSKLYGYDADVIKGIEKYVVEGKIDYDKLASGEEVIFVVPQKVQFRVLIGHNLYGSNQVFDENINKKSPRYEDVLSGESNYKVGDELTFATRTAEYNESKDTNEYKLYSKNTVKIGAIIRPNSLEYRSSGIGIYNASIITSLEGINKLAKGLNYTDVNFNVLTDIDDDTDTKIIDDMNKYTEKYGGWVNSKYRSENLEAESNRQMLTAIIALIIIGFVICISIVNNSITAHIRENKRVIGTLRAVGADAGDLVKSYVRQMLTMFGWGTGIGYGLFIAIFVIMKIVASTTVDGRLELIFNPWITIAMTVLSFVICAINVYTKIKKEMKNSIVDNIREL